MTVIQIDEIMDGKGGQSSGPGESSITRAFRVYTNNAYDTPLEISPQMPIQYGMPLASSPAYLALGVNFTMDHKGPVYSVWTVTYTFKTVQVEEEEVEKQNFPNPLDRRCRVSIRQARYGELKVLDFNGDAKRTSAGEIYPPTEVDAPRYTLSFHKNYTTIPDWVWDLQNKLNSDAVTVRGKMFDAKTLKFSLEEIPEKKIENGVRHFPIRWVLEYRRDTWIDKRVDAGFYYLDANGKLVRMTDNDGSPTVVEEWLDGSGGRLRDIIDNPQPGDETINEFDDYEEASFSQMPLNEVASGTA